MAGSHFSNGDSIMLLDWRHGSIELKVWKLERAFKEQEGARGKTSVAFRLAVFRRSPLRMEVTEIRGDWLEEDIELAQATHIRGARVTRNPAIRGEAGHGVHKASSSRPA